MIDLYTYRTSNGRKASIMLEECGLDYALHIVDITRGEQNAAAFRAINPNGRIPAIVDRDGPDGGPLTLFESGAILLYLAQKTKKFLPPDEKARWRAIQWLMWQMGGVGPNFGQAFHFLHQYPEDAPKEAIAYGQAHPDRVLGFVLRGLPSINGSVWTLRGGRIFGDGTAKSGRVPRFGGAWTCRHGIRWKNKRNRTQNEMQKHGRMK